MQSLKQQTYRDFEWLIVDDGLSGNPETPQIVAGWQSEGLINLRYIWTENAGKHMAFNLAIREAHGDRPFATVDSDDALSVFARRLLPALG